MDSYEKQLETSWQINSKAWAESIRQEKIKSRITVTNPAILKTILSRNPQTVLDIGCGEGWLARELSQHGIAVTGIDGSESLIEEAKKLGGGTYHWLNYNQFAECPEKIGTEFDLVVLNFSLLSEDIQPVLQACRKVTNEQGVVVIQTLHPSTIIQSQNERYENGWRIEDFHGMGDGYKANMPWYFRTLSTWITDIHQAGLQLVDCDEPIEPLNGKPLSLILIATPK
ncbi:class I SAM-dependent methyltransferase [Bacillus carboniphilus]|uniref:Class I SAM-dependent methyltransferase n=1 Tax=Bacillus carboniphilus TaxID=86663 RepID=A0ABP3GFI5_9BACI